MGASPLQTWPWAGVPVEVRTRVELLGARFSRWLNRAGKPWSVREDGGEAGSAAYYQINRLIGFVYSIANMY